MNMFKSTFQPAPAPAANINSINGFASSASSAPRQEDPFYATSFLDEPICEPNAPLLRLALKSRAENKPQNLIPLEDFVTPQPGRVFRRTDGEVIGGMPPDTPLRGYGSTMEEIDEEEEEEAFELSTFIEEYQQEFNVEEYQEEFNEESYFDLSAPADEDDESFGRSMDLDQTPPVASTSILPPDLHAPRATMSAAKQAHTVHASTSPPSPARLSKRSTPVPMAKATDSSPKNRRTSSPSPTESVRSGSGSGESGGDLGDFSQVFQYLNQEKEKSLAFQAELSGSGSDKKSPGGTIGGESASSSSRKSTSTTTTRHKKKNRRSRSQDDYVGASTDTDFLPPTRTILKSQSRPSLRRQVLSTPGQPIRGSGTPDSPFDLVTPPPKARRRSRLSKELGSVQEKRVDWLSGDFSMAEGEDEHRSSLERSWAPLPPSLPKTSPAKPPALRCGRLHGSR
ncbi:hypothetical protein BT69DRAFT_534609 [Atractiella rhizophila]|nr:hypothetical protein BT69DRAFT_534609 [Atractiella rhizophila]